MEPDINLYFDASGHTRVDSIITLIERMSAGGFQNTLSYVYIPSLDHGQGGTDNHGTRSERRAYGGTQELRENPNMGRSDLVRVSDKLSKCKVKRILRLQVDDLKPPAHTDAAIELALKGVESLQLPQGHDASVGSSSRKDALTEERQKSREPILVEHW